MRRCRVVLAAIKETLREIDLYWPPSPPQQSTHLLRFSKSFPQSAIVYSEEEKEKTSNSELLQNEIRPEEIGFEPQKVRKKAVEFIPICFRGKVRIKVRINYFFDIFSNIFISAGTCSDTLRLTSLLNLWLSLD